MSQPSDDHQGQPFEKGEGGKKRLPHLSYEGTYSCPICRHGEIQALFLTEAFACNFCRHIFTANEAAQTLQVVDSAQPMGWRWSGQHWRSLSQNTDLTVLIWIIGLLLMVVPPGVLWLGLYIFPPLPGSPGAQLPYAWVLLTFLTHASIVLWLAIEHYQPPLYVMAKLRLQQLLDQQR